MKKIGAILFISMLLFNIVGYKLIFSYLEKNATSKLEEKIDAGQYDESQLIEIKIPLQLPYYNDSEYQPCYGETEFDGEHYRYVKRKVTGNMLYLLCLPHTEKDNIAALKTDFEKAVNDVPQNGAPQKGQVSFLKLILSDFLLEERTNDFALQLIASQDLHSSDSYLTSQFEPKTAAQPPDAL